MSYSKINRSSPNDGQGDDARTWAGKTNANFEEVFSRNFPLNGVMVSRMVYDPNVLSFDVFKDEDKIEGWENPATKDRWVEGKILDASSFTWPTDIDTTAKFFITNDKLTQ